MRLARLRAHKRAAVALSALIAVAGCATQPAPAPTQAAKQAAPVIMTLAPVSFERLPGWGQDRASAALPAFIAGCAAMGSARSLGGGGQAAQLGGSANSWRSACNAARSVPDGDEAAARGFFERYFQPYAIAGDGSTQGLFTGYYEPQVRGATTRGAPYLTPLIGEPHDIIQADLGAFADDLKGRKITGRVQDGRFLPYLDRAAISQGALSGRNLELLWLSDPIDAFFMEIQGSGRVLLPDGSVIRVSYAGENGRPYVPIGRVLIDRGEIPRDQVSLQSIRAWLLAHPGDAAAVMDQNPSYVFFREVRNTRADQGPSGSLGAPLTPGRSLAVDRSYLPLGAPLWLDTTDPLSGAPLRRLVVAQDTGGAIKGPVRGDVFWGWGPDAEARAGKMKSQGTAYVLLPR